MAQLSLTFLASVGAIAIIQGALVAFQRQDTLTSLTNLRSPGWALALPGLILIGTFGLVLVPAGAGALVIAGALAAPVLAFSAVIAVLKGPRVVAAGGLIVVAGIGAGACSGVLGQVCASLITACGAALIGSIIVRLIPGRWLLVSIAIMCLADFILMHLGVGQLSSQLLDTATRRFHGPDFDGADIGSIDTEYPDLLLAAVIGALVAAVPTSAAPRWWSPSARRPTTCCSWASTRSRQPRRWAWPCSSSSCPAG